MFSGDVSKFYKFINRYGSLMRNVMDPQVKLNYLLMWTKRMAHESIEHCEMIFHGDYEAAFREALRILYLRFFTPCKIVNKTVEDIINNKEVKPHSENELWSLINELNLCDAATKAKEGMAHDLWTTDKIRKIIQKRCPFLKDKWSDVAFAIEETGREATFEHFLNFLMKHARKAGSTYGRSAYQDEAERKIKTEGSNQITRHLMTSPCPGVHWILRGNHRLPPGA
jgi:hypothetical protein